ncbi:MAG: substrate-binding domain-containing protein [Thermodesulfobacteriota bacterium]|nr:substrate-binding domain-containing protein [Thermodesulfobacteriota bacterium]
MRKNILSVSIMCVTVVAILAVFSVRNVGAQNVIKYSCSAQIYEALEKVRLDAFTQRTGLKIEVHVCSSSTAVNQLVNGYTDLASTAWRLSPLHKQDGYYETVFSRDPVAIVVNTRNPVTDITTDILKDVFAGEITNWKELSGSDEPILVVLPTTYTASYKNFSRNVMGYKKMNYDIMTRLSSKVMEIVDRFPWAISFIAEGAATHSHVKTLRVDGRNPMDMGYPYYQVFSFVTKGKPTGVVKEFIDDLLSGPGREIMKERRITPYYE